MVVINVDVPDVIAKQVVDKKTITIDTLYDYDENISSWSTVKVGEKASVVLDFLKNLK